MEEMKEVRQGWRAFECDVRGLVFALPCRDHSSYSREDCPRCYGSLDSNPCQPFDSWPDENMRVDQWGNLINGGRP
jgi:hypothetical protein